MNNYELKEASKNILIKLFNKFENESFMGLKKYFILFISIILFISPITIFNMTYGKGLFEGSYEYEKIILNLIINTLIFVILYIIGSVREAKEVKNIEVFNIIMTLFLMGIISLGIIVSYYIYIFFTESTEFRIGIISLVLIILILVAYYSLKWVKLFKDLNNNINRYIEINDEENKEERIEKMKSL